MASTEGIRKRNIQGSGEKRLKWEFVEQQNLPHFLKDNEYLLKRHRPELNSYTECIKSVFFIHTETGNIWTHFGGFLVFLCGFLYFLIQPSIEIQRKVALSSFFIGAIFCLGCSSLYHALGCHSETVSKVLAKLDYVGIVVLIVSSFPPWLYYGFYCDPVLKYVYTIAIILIGSACVFVVTNEKFARPLYRPLRAGLFVALGLTGAVPGVHFMVLEGLYMTVHFASWLGFMALLYIVGAIIYALRIPERLKPGMFDLLGQSHQIMHMCVIAGAFTCFFGANKLAKYRHMMGDTCVPGAV